VKNRPQTYSVAHLDTGAARRSVRILNYDAVKEAAKLDRLSNLRYFWTDDRELILVSKTEELQRFLLTWAEIRTSSPRRCVSPARNRLFN